MEIYFYSFYRTDEYFSAHKKAWNELFLKIRRKFSISRKAFQYLFIYQIVVCLFNSLVFSISRFYVNYYSWGDLVLLGFILFHFSVFFFLSIFVLDGVGTIILDWVSDADFWATQSEKVSSEVSGHPTQSKSPGDEIMYQTIIKLPCNQPYHQYYKSICPIISMETSFGRWFQ
jgi:hypothetical protein